MVREIMISRKDGKMKIAISVVAAALLLAGCDKETTLHAGLPEQQANLVMAALLDAGITCSKEAGEEGTWNVMVSEQKFAAAVNLLEQKGLPRRAHMGVGEVFKKTGMISSPSEERIRFMDALAQDLAKTISSRRCACARGAARERPVRAKCASFLRRGRHPLALGRRHNRHSAVRKGTRKECNRGARLREDNGDDIQGCAANEIS